MSICPSSVATSICLRNSRLVAEDSAGKNDASWILRFARASDRSRAARPGECGDDSFES